MDNAFRLVPIWLLLGGCAAGRRETERSWTCDVDRRRRCRREHCAAKPRRSESLPGERVRQTPGPSRRGIAEETFEKFARCLQQL
jgi:hypothetical protein